MVCFFFSLDLLAAFLFELDLIMTDLLKIKFWEPTFTTFWLWAQRAQINATSVDGFLLRNRCLYTHLCVRNMYKYANLHMHLSYVYTQTLKFGFVVVQGTYSGKLGQQTKNFCRSEKIGWSDVIFSNIFLFFPPFPFFKKEFQVLFCCRSINRSQCMNGVHDDKCTETKDYTKPILVFAYDTCQVSSSGSLCSWLLVSLKAAKARN